MAVAAVAVPTAAVTAGSGAAPAPPGAQVNNEFTDNQAKAFKGWGLSPEVRREDADAPSPTEVRESRTDHDGARSADEVRDLVADIAPSMLATDAIVPPADTIEQPLSSTALQIKGKDGRPGGVVQSDQPLAIPTKKTKRNPRGLKIADLDWERDGSRIDVQGPAVPVSLPSAADGTAEFGDLRVDLAPDAKAVTGSVTGEAVTYPGVDTDEDLVVRSTSVGFEASWLLRSPDADREIRIPVDVPSGGRLLRNDDDSVEIQDKDRESVGRMTPPAASDAARQRVPLQVAVDGDEIVITAKPDETDTLWPVLVDPQFVAQWDAGTNAAAKADFDNWKEAKSRGNINIYTGKIDPRDDAYKLFGGLIINGYTGNYGGGTNQYLQNDFASWNRYAPGDQAGPDSRDPAWAPTYNSASQRYESNEHAYWWRFDIGGVNYQNNRGQSDPALGFGLLNKNGSAQAGIKYQNQTSSGTFTNESYDPTVRAGGPVGYLNGTAGAGATIYSGSSRGDYTGATVNPDNVAAMSIQDKGTLGTGSRGDTSAHMGWYRLYTTDAFKPRITSAPQGMSAWSETAPTAVNNVTAADHGIGVQLTGLVSDSGSVLGQNLESCVAGSSGICTFYAPAHNYNLGQVGEGRRNYELQAIDAAGNIGRQNVPLLIDRSAPGAQELEAGTVRPNSSDSTAKKTLKYRLTDSYSGVKSISVSIDGGAPEPVAQPSCTSDQCPTSVDVEIPASRVAKLGTGPHHADVVVSDMVPLTSDAEQQKRHRTKKTFDFVVYQDAGSSPPAGTTNVGRQIQGGLGFEDFYTYDTTPTGAGSNLRVNLATGGTSWAVTPISNPGIGLDTVFRLTYNSYEPAGLLPGLVKGGILGYNQAGNGFSAQLGSITRLNEPLWFETEAGLPLGQADAPSLVRRIVMTDGDGTQQEFKKNSRTGTQFDPPPGVELKFRLFSSSDQKRRWAATRPDGTTFYFGADGLPTYTKDRHGNQLELQYSNYNAANGCGFVLLCQRRVTRIVDAAGFNADGTENASASDRAWTVSYDPNTNQLAKIVDRKRLDTGNPSDRPRRETTFGYDSNTGQLTTINEASNAPGTQPKRTFTLGYNAQTRYLTSIQDPKSKTTKVTYDDPPQDLNALLGQILGGTGLFENVRPVKSIEDRSSTSGNRITGYRLVADGTGHKTYVRDARKNVDEVKTDARGRMTQLTQGANDDTTTDEVLPATPRVSTQSWTSDNYVQSSSQGVGSDRQVSTDYTWGSLGELQKEVEHSGAPGTNQDPGTKQNPSETSRTRSWDYQYGPGTNLAQDSQDAGDDGKFVYDLKAETDRRFNTTTYGYGTTDAEKALGDVRTIDKPSSTNDRQQFTYTPQGLLSSHTQNVWDGIASKPTLNGSEPTSNTESWSNFDQNGDAGTYTDQRSKTTRIGHDEVGNTTFVGDPRSAWAQSGTLPSTGPEAAAARSSNPVGLLSADTGSARSGARSTGAAYTARWTYDALDRQVTQVLPKRSGSGARADRFRVTATTFDLNDNPTDQLDGNNKVSTKTYSATDQVKQSSTPPTPHYAPAGSDGEPVSTDSAETTSYDYDVVDNVLERVDPLGTSGQKGHRTLWTYNEFDEPTVQTQDHTVPTNVPSPNPTPASVVVSRAYDVRGNVIGEVDANTNAKFPTDPAANAADVAKQRTAYEWDPFDRLKSSTENPGRASISGKDVKLKTTYKYDGEDHQVEKTSPGGRTEKNAFDDAGRLISQSQPFGYNGSSTDSFAVTTWKLRGDGVPYTMTAPRGNDGAGANGFQTGMSYYPTGELRSRQLPRRDDAQYGPVLHVDYTINDVGDPISVQDARANALRDQNVPTTQNDENDPRQKPVENTFLDTGELASTTRPSWWIYDQDDGAVRERTDYDPAPKSMTEDDLPAESEHGDFGSIAPQDLPDVLPAKGATTLDYDDELRLTSVESRDDSTTGNTNPIVQSMTYDPVGRPTGRTIPLGDSTTIRLRWQYDANGNMRAAYDGRNAVTLSSYDDYDRKVTQTDPANCNSCDATERPKTETGYDQNGNVLYEELPAAGDPGNQTKGGANGKTSTKYDAVDRPFETTDASGSTTTKEYDADGLVAKSYAPRAALESTAAGKDRYATTYVYDGAGRVTKQTAQATDGGKSQSLVTDTTYDRDGNVVRVESPGAAKTSADDADNPARRVQTREYDGRDLPWSTTIGTGNDRHTTITEYDGNGWLRRTIKPRGVNTAATPVRPTDADDPQAAPGGDQNRNAETLEYDPDGLMLARNLPWGDGDRAQPDAQATRWRQEFSYTPRGVLKTVSGVFDKKGNGTGKPDQQTTVTTNRAGWPTQTVSHDGGDGASTAEDVTFNYTYDKQGNQLTWNAGSGRNIRRDYFPSGQMAYRCGVRDSGPSTSEEQIYSYKYDRSGALTGLTDWNHHQVQDTGLCNEKAATGTDAGDSIGTQVTRITRDRAGRPIAVDEKYSPTKNQGRDTAYDYVAGAPDLIDNVKTDGTLTSTTGAYTGGTTSTFAYDEQDRNTKVTVDTAETDAEKKPATRVSDIRFWPSGDRRELQKPATTASATSRTKDTRFYDTAGLISQRTVNPASGTTRTTDYTYDSNGNRTRDERGGTSQNPGYEYNARDQLTSWTRSRNGAAPAGTEKDPKKTVTYGLDGSGRQLESHQTIVGKQNQVGEVTTTIDTLNGYRGDRLIKSDRTIKVGVVPDENVVITPVKDEYQTDCYAYNAMGSQTVAIRNSDSVNKGDQHAPYAAASCPSTIKVQSGWRTENQNTFDTFERLVASRQRAHTTTNKTDTGTLKDNEAYCYDALDRRDRKLTNLSASQNPGEDDDNPTAFQKARAACTQKQDADVGVYDLSYLGLTEQLTRENRSSGVQTYEYDATGQRLGRMKANDAGKPTWRSYDTDAQGTVVGLEKADTGDTTPNADGKKNTYDIDPYGDPIGDDDKDLSPDASSNPFQYQGFYKDQDTGNYDMQARAYRPSVGQFLQQDRFADPKADLTLASDPLTSSRYAFTAANPATRSEYNGHAGEIDPQAAARQRKKDAALTASVLADIKRKGTVACANGCGSTADSVRAIRQSLGLRGSATTVTPAGAGVAKTATAAAPTVKKPNLLSRLLGARTQYNPGVVTLGSGGLRTQGAGYSSVRDRATNLAKAGTIAFCNPLDPAGCLPVLLGGVGGKALSLGYKAYAARRAYAGATVAEDAISGAAKVADDLPRGGAKPEHGPFHRRPGGSNTDEEMALAREGKLNEVQGKTNRYGSEPSVDAFNGPLPAGQNGYEFYTTVAPRPGTPDWLSQWRFGRPGVRDLGDGRVSIPCRVSKCRLP